MSMFVSCIFFYPYVARQMLSSFSASSSSASPFFRNRTNSREKNATIRKNPPGYHMCIKTKLAKKNRIFRLEEKQCVVRWQAEIAVLETKKARV